MNTINSLKLVVIFIILFPSNSAYSANGCSLHGANFLSGSNSVKLVRFPGNENFSNHFLSMIFDIQNILKLPDNHLPFIGFYDDNKGPNALAISDAWVESDMAFLAEAGKKSRNAILFGEKMLWKLAFPNGESSLNTTEIYVVLSHEFAHTLQAIAKQKPGSITVRERLSRSPTKNVELMADAIAGWVFGRNERTRRENYSVETLEQVISQMYSIGDFQFNSENHHGTPEERVSAFIYGYESSHETRNAGTMFMASLNKYIPD